MKICPVCNDSFPDELNFCDIDGTRLNREANGQDRNKWWSLLGAGLLVGAVVISAASIIFLPKARVALPVVNSEPQSLPVPAKAPSVDSAATVAAATPTSEPDTSAADVVAPELKKKDKPSANSNAGEAAPNPKAAALAAEGVDRTSSSRDANKNAASSSNKSEPPSAVKSVSDTRPSETSARPAQVPADLKDQKTQPVNAKGSDKASDKKKTDDKEKKKGGFLRVFKKIFGKD
jgi:hypothetical protein